mmetsp:Transcript_10485/g.32546  ORF Transcript_10485/g.32546 Transcript_10485/m.32546 type:complete len:331 (+) Transcript_10485:154-1146(+)
MPRQQSLVFRLFVLASGSIGVALFCRDLGAGSLAAFLVAPRCAPDCARRRHRQRGTRQGLAPGRCTVALAALPDLGPRWLGRSTASPASAQRCIEQLRQRLLREQQLPLWRGRPATLDSSLLWWFLRDRRLDVAESAEKLVKCLQWRRDFRVDKLGPELFSREMRARKAYLHRHTDVLGRPVLVAVARRHNVMERRLSESCRMFAWCMERTLERLDTMEPPSDTGTDPAGPPSDEEPVEQALGIIDLRGFSPLQADLEFATFLVEALYIYYPGRFGRILMVDAPDVFGNFWDSVRPLLRRYASLTDFVTADEVRQRYFAPGHAPEEFGPR